MAKIVFHAGTKKYVVMEGISTDEAIEKVADFYRLAGLDNRLTGISISCTYAVRCLKRYELDKLLDIYPDFFLNRKYDTEQGAYIVTDSEYLLLDENIVKWTIEQ